MYILYGADFVMALLMEVPITAGNKIVYRNPEMRRVSGDRPFSKPSWHASRLAGRKEELKAQSESMTFLLSVC